MLTKKLQFPSLAYEVTAGIASDRRGPRGISIRDLVQLPHLQAKVMAGGSGMDRNVSWAHVMESDEPWNWLEPHDLVLTSGAIIPRGAAAQARFVEKMAASGLSGIAIGESDLRPPLSQSMRRAADRVGFPLIIAGHGVSFVEYVRVVAAANERGENRSLNQIIRVHGEVMAGLMEQRGSADFLAGLSRVVDCALHVIDPGSWEPLLKDCSAPDPSWKDAYDADVRKWAGRAPFVMHLTVGEQTALAMPVPIERPACLLVFPETDPPPRLAVLQQVAAACAVEIGRLDASVERYRRSGAGLLNDALDGRLEPAVVESLFHERRLDSGMLAFALGGCSPAIDRLVRSWTIREIPFLLGGWGSSTSA